MGSYVVEHTLISTHWSMPNLTYITKFRLAILPSSKLVSLWFNYCCIPKPTQMFCFVPSRIYALFEYHTHLRPWQGISQDITCAFAIFSIRVLTIGLHAPPLLCNFPPFASFRPFKSQWGKWVRASEKINNLKVQPNIHVGHVWSINYVPRVCLL